MNAIELDSVILDFPIKTGARYLKEQVTGRFKTEGRRTHLRALDKVNMQIQQGEILGIIGPNGAGKSTILRVMAGIYSPDDGTVKTRGKCVLLAGIGTGFQSNLTGRENIKLNGSIMGLSDDEIVDRMDEIIAFSEIPDFIDQPIRTYSMGMKARLGFAIAAHLEPEILLIDEVMAVGDAAFQKKCKERIKKMVSGDTTVVIVSHNMSTVKSFCDRAVCIHEGIIHTSGEGVDDAIQAYQRILSEEE
ncbi:MAG: ABC transporter ATP-binding protein [Candidatus Thalassarchaeaceae archaeon]